ncbi:haloalkane dehalogenase [Pedobacter lusitanus]|uniref:Contig77, whole genome shotgun sequence n=2 Tax=Pedobacter lusitanus TaxID=1503925 RepID=A0A0D0FU63_9SPHI|nr:haloalkane dehalogenase [Pedobacter lusitanus]
MDNKLFGFPFQKKFREINGVNMAYIEEGEGDPIVFLHGNPTSSYIWRNILPHMQKLGRCIAPDLMGMGDSSKLLNSNSHTFAENAKYVNELFEQLGINRNIIFVVHDWGAALAFDWASRHSEAVKGIVYMEAVMRLKTWSELPPPAEQFFKAIRSEKGEGMVLQQNALIEFNLSGSVLRQLSPEEMDQYRRPFKDAGEGRRPMLNWARQLPFEGEPVNIVKIVSDYNNWLAHSPISKLFIEANPGTQSEKEKEFCNTLSNQTHVTVKGHHHLQEDSPDEIGTAISKWIQKLK